MAETTDDSCTSVRFKTLHNCTRVRFKTLHNSPMVAAAVTHCHALEVGAVPENNLIASICREGSSGGTTEGNTCAGRVATLMLAGVVARTQNSKSKRVEGGND
jgi:hypothetical protein